MRTVWKTGSISVKYDMPYTFYFSIYIGKRLTTPSASTYWKMECKTWKSTWPVKVLLSHLVHLTWDHFKHDPDFTLSLHIQVFANSGIQYCVGTLLRCVAIHILSLSSHSPASWPARHVRVAERSLQLSICCKGFSWCKMPPANFNFISDAVASLVQPDLNSSCAWYKCWLYYGDKINSLCGRTLLIGVKMNFSIEKQAGCEIN